MARKTSKRTGKPVRKYIRRKPASAGQSAGESVPEFIAQREPAPAPVGAVAPAIVDVPINEAELIAEAAAIAGAAPDPVAIGETQSAPDAAPEVAAPAPAFDPAQRAAEVQPAVTFAVHQLADFVAPNWKVTKDECAQVGEALSQVLAYWMPETNIEPKYLALMNLGVSLWGVAASRRDPETGAFKALRAVKVKASQPAPVSVAPVEPVLSSI